MFDKLRSLFKKTEDDVQISISTKIKKTVTGKAKLSDDEIENTSWNLQMNLMQNDVAMEVAERISEELREKLKDMDFSNPKEDIRKIFKEVLLGILQIEKPEFLQYLKAEKKPIVIVFFGVNGTGKTTTIAKLVKYLKDNHFSVVLAAADTFRAGAIEQLEKHAKNLDVKLVKHQRGADSAAVIFDAITHAKSKNIDVVLADTSGRMQSNVDLMGEMQKICRVNKPNLKIFVGDALTGNDAIDQARQFNEAVGIDYSILAKCDASKGGAALSISHVTKKPILFIGTGQTYDDLELFNPQKFVDDLV